MLWFVGSTSYPFQVGTPENTTQWEFTNVFIPNCHPQNTQGSLEHSYDNFGSIMLYRRKLLCVALVPEWCPI